VELSSFFSPAKQGDLTTPFLLHKLRGMNNPISQIENLYSVLGGAAEIARRTRVTAGAVSQWKSKGKIPPEYYQAFLVLAAEASLAVEAEIHVPMEFFDWKPVCVMQDQDE
jgi:hypothetical protein